MRVSLCVDYRGGNTLCCMAVLRHGTGTLLHVQLRQYMAFGCELDSRDSIPGADGFFLLDGVSTGPGAHRCSCLRVPRSFPRE